MRRSLWWPAVIGLAMSLCLPAWAVSGPSAVDDRAESDGKVVHIDVLANDTAAEGLDTATLAVVSAPSLGQALVIATGSPRIKYTASASQTGIDSFRYQICDRTGVCAIATVTVNGLLGGTTTTTAPIVTPTDPAPVTSTTTTTTDEPVTATTLTTEVMTPTETTTPTAPAPDTSGKAADPAPAAPLGPDGGSVARTEAGVHLLGELALASHMTSYEAGTTVGETRDIHIDEDMRYLGRSGLDTIEVVAMPAVMASGLVGFLLVGLPQNLLGAASGFLLACWRRKRVHPEKAEPTGADPS